MSKNLVILLATFLALGGYATATIGRFLPFNGFQPIPAKTPGIINIKVSDVKNITTFPILFLTNGNEKGILKNTGHSAEIFLDGTLTANGIVGGVLGLNDYVFRKFRFYWAGSTDGVAGTTVNGKNGTPLEVWLYYYNVKYKSFKNALRFRDGIVNVIFRIELRSVPNVAFDALATALKRVRKAESQVEIGITESFLFFVRFPPESKYFVYPSSYINETTGRHYSCVTTIVPPINPYQFISKEQFTETFLMLLNENGKPLTNIAKQSPRKGRPVVQSAGLIKVPSFIKRKSRV